MFKLNGIKIGAALLMLSSVANAAVIIDSQQIPTEDIVSITISPNSGNLFITTAVGYEVKPVGGSVTPSEDVAISSFTASPATFVEGGSTTLSWNTSNAASCTPSGGNAAWRGRTISLASGSTSLTISTPDTYAFTLTCQSSTGETATRNLTVEVTEEPGPAVVNCPASPLGGRTESWTAYFGAVYPNTAQQSTSGSAPRNGYQAIKFNSGTFTGSGNLTSVGLTSTTGTRLVSISECPGDFAVSNYCKQSFGTGGAVIWSTTSANRTCVLKPNTDYYVNVTFTNGSDPTETSCGSTYCETKLQYLKR